MKDRELIALFLQRDERALEVTQAVYGAYLRSIAAGIAGAEDAEECVNDALLRAWNAIPPERPERLSAYLGRIARNLALNRYAADTAKKRGGATVHTSLDELAECLPSGSDPAMEAEAAELSRALNRFLRGLPVRDCNVFLARYWNALPVKEIAVRFFLRENTVKSSLRRTREKLRRFLEQEELL